MSWLDEHAAALKAQADKEAAETIARIEERAKKKLGGRLPKLNQSYSNLTAAATAETAQVAQYLKRVNRVYKWDELRGEMVCEMPEEGVVRIVRAEKVKQADLFGGSDPYAEIFWNDQKVGQTAHIEDTHNPEWDESFPLLVQPGQVNTLRVEVL